MPDRWKSPTSLILAVLVAGGILAVSPAAANARNGAVMDAPSLTPRIKTMVKVSDSQRDRILAALGDEWSWAPPRCFGVYATRSNRNWITIQYSGAQGIPGCEPFDGMMTYKKSGGAWKFVVGGSGLTCEDFKKALREGAASKSVVRDLSRVYFCFRVSSS